MKKTYLTFLLMCFAFFAFAQTPVIPGYFADPSIKQYDGKYYIYVTTDGYGPFLKDLINDVLKALDIKPKIVPHLFGG